MYFHEHKANCAKFTAGGCLKRSPVESTTVDDVRIKSVFTFNNLIFPTKTAYLSGPFLNVSDDGDDKIGSKLTTKSFFKKIWTTNCLCS